jgi:hypothetical protein
MHGAMPDFDPDGTFEARYVRCRRGDDGSEKEDRPYLGELGDPQKREGP